MKNITLSTKVIIPVFIIGILTSFISFYYITKVMENVIDNEIEKNVNITMDHFEDYIEGEYKIYSYLKDVKDYSKEFSLENVQNKTINILKKETHKSKDILYLITEDKIINISPLSQNIYTIDELKKKQKVTINSLNYKIKVSKFEPWNWELILLHDKSNFKHILYENQSFIFTTTFILLASIVIVLIVIFHFNVNQPLNILFRHLENISKGKYELIEHKFNTKEFDSLSSYINVMSLSVDIREKDAKSLLKKTQEKEDFISDVLNSQENIIVVKENEEILTVNNAFFKLFDKYENIEEFKIDHKSISEYFKKDDDLVYNFEDKNWIDYVLNTKDKIHKVKIKPNDKEYTFALHVIKSQKYSRVIISLTDISELEKSNTLLSEYKKAVDAGAIVSKTDANGAITYVNDKFLNISGYSKEELIGKNHNILKSPTMSDEIYKDMWTTIKSKKIWQGEIENIKKSGEPYFVAATIVPIVDSNDTITEFVGIRYDITDQVKAKKRAIKAEETKGQFLANMSHEIRTPLNAIIGFTKLLTNMNLDNKTEKYIDTIDKSANNLLGIVNDILDLSKIESGYLELEEIEFNPKDEFTSITNLFSIKAKEKNLEFISNIDSTLPNIVIGDPLRLKQILSNLISNGIKFTKEGFIKVDIKLQELEKNSCKIRFIIEDSGIGIEKQKQEHIFTAFSQADNSITREFGGTGLGLSITSNIIKSLNSKINLESEVNKGSKFSFDLEFKTNSNKTKTLPKIEEKKKVEKKYEKFDAKILVAEDHPVNQELISILLELRDINFKIVNNGQEAIELFKIENFDLILMDINMPVKNGLEAVEEIISYEKQEGLEHTAIIALSANAIESEKQKALNCGMDDYLYKPIDEEHLDLVLKKYISNNTREKNVEASKFDIDKTTKDLGLSQLVVKKLISKFITSVDKDLTSLETAIQNNDLENIKNYSHKIKGAALNLRLEDISTHSKNLEENFENKDFDFKNELKKLKSSIEEIKNIIG